MSKKKKSQNKKKNTAVAVQKNDVVLEENGTIDAQQQVADGEAVAQKADNKKAEKNAVNAKNDKNAKNSKNAKGKNSKQKEKGKLKRKAKETFAELKKVTWPSFGDVCKKTGTVLVVVLIFAVIIYGIDYCLGLLMNLLR